MEQTFSPEPANFTETSSQPTPIPITKEKKSWAIPVLSMAMIVLSAGLVYLYFENQKLSQIVSEASLSQAMASPDTIVATPPVEVDVGQKVQPETAIAMKKYTSPRGYSLQYPEKWDTLFFDESIPSTLGAHVLTSYSVTEVENFMDHGSVDWKKYLGDTPAVKIQLSAGKIEGSPEMFEESLMRQLVYEQMQTVSTKSPVSDLKIGNLPTFRFIGTADSLSPSHVSSDLYLAYPAVDRYITVSVVTYNASNREAVTRTEAWKEVQQFMNSFTLIAPKANY